MAGRSIRPSPLRTSRTRRSPGSAHAKARPDSPTSGAQYGYRSDINLSPRTGEIRLDACTTDPGRHGRIERYDWTITPSGSPATPRQLSTDRCETGFGPYSTGNPPYTVRLRARGAGGADGAVLERTTVVPVRDLFVVSLGDSMASGEGNPDEAGDFVPVPLSHALWKHEACHRSARGGHTKAAKAIDAADPRTGMLFLSLACTGAGVDDLISSSHNDRITKNALPSSALDAGDGNDVITIGQQTGTGVNNLFGGTGIDTLNGGAGADVLFGGPDNDVLNGNGGNDVASAGVSGDGADVFNGGTGFDGVSYFLRGIPLNVSLDGIANDGEPGEGDNNRTDVENVTGGAASDILTGNATNNRLVGGFGNDTLNGLGGLDRLSGESGRDVLNGGLGIDRLDGGEGNDTVNGGDDGDILNGGPGPIDDVDGLITDTDTLNGGAGIDTADYAARSVRIVVDLDGVADDGEAGEGDNVRVDVENVTGGLGSDTLTGNALANSLNGRSGDDRLIGAGGNDVLTGGAGADSMFGGNGGDDLRGIDFVAGNDTLSAGSGTDVCSSDAGDAEIACEA